MNIFRKEKRIQSWLVYYQNYRLPKTWLHKYKKSNASEYPWTSNMVNGSKHWRYLNGDTFIIFIDHRKDNWVWESYSNFEFPKTWLDKHQKCSASEYPRTSKIVILPKHCWNLNGGTFIILIDRCERYWVWKRHS